MSHSIDNRAVPALLALAALGSCSLGTQLKTPTIAAPMQYTASTQPMQTIGPGGRQGEVHQFENGSEVPPQWWTLYQSPELDGLVAQALAGSPQLAEASARLRGAEADLAAEIGNTRYPAVNAQLQATREKVYPGAFGFTQFAQPPPFSLFNASVDASYTLDLFGANRHAVDRQRATVRYQRYLWQSARLTLAANVVTAAIRRAAIQDQIVALESVLAAQRREVAIENARFAAGGVSALDVQAQRTQLAQNEAALAPLQAQGEQLAHQLAIYLGQAPAGASLPELRFETLTLPATLPLALPSTLARHRPDIAAAEAQLAEAGAAVGIATANLYPQISLSASLGSERTSIGSLSDGLNVWSLGGNLLQPLFHGGALLAQRRSAVAAYDAAAASYQQTVLGALQQVADTLRALEHDAEALAAREEATEQAAAGLAIAQQQFQVGGISEFTLKEAERTLAQAQQTRTGAAADRLADTAALLQALGGTSWVDAAP
jgi:NodT family efflux transporter outer membrane factor (OMF) lipoprotein